MSRIGNRKLVIPQGVTVEVKENNCVVTVLKEVYHYQLWKI